MQNLYKSTQMKELCCWLSRNTLPAYVRSFHKIALWCRRQANGQLVIPLVNASLDPVTGVEICVRKSGRYQLEHLDGREEQLKASQRKGDYTVLAMPPLKPWEFALLTKAE